MGRVRAGRAFGVFGGVSVLMACTGPSDFRNDAYDSFCKEQGLPPISYRFDHDDCTHRRPNACGDVIAKLGQKGCREGKLGHDRLFCCAE